MTTEGNQLISLKEFEAIPNRRGKKKASKEVLVLEALNPGTAIIFAEHGEYKCTTWSCGLRTMAARVAKRRGLLWSTIHLSDGRIAVAFYSNGTG